MESSEVQEKGGASGRVLKEGWGRAAAAGAARRHFPSAGDGGWRREGGASDGARPMCEEGNTSQPGATATQAHSESVCVR